MSNNQDIVLMNLSNAELDALFGNVPAGIMITDKYSNIVYVNSSFSAITGFSLNEIVGQKPHVLSSGKHDSLFYQSMWSNLMALNRWQGEIWNRRKTGEIYPEFLSISTIKNKDGQTEGYLGIFSDATVNKQKEEVLNYSATHDSLTQLANRTLLWRFLRQSIINASFSEKMVAILFIDLDRFKPVNDNYGHEYGDELLKLVAKRLVKSVRSEDMVVRSGGDEFIIVLPQLPSGERAITTSQQVINSIAQPFSVLDKNISISSSVGISFYPTDGKEADDLIKKADSAMYEAKSKGGGTYCLAGSLSGHK
jgi:diguanylate cyclase (GGDEF)-like protein/PAS domain S-box-containing protein